MTRDEMIAEFTKMLDRAWEAGWDEGYGEGVMVGHAEAEEANADLYDDGYILGLKHGRALQMDYIREMK